MKVDIIIIIIAITADCLTIAWIKEKRMVGMLKNP